MSVLNSKNVLIVGSIAFLVMSFWGLYFMSLDMNCKMLDCPFMDGSANFCPMSISDHISQWQQAFTGVREKSLFSLISLLLILLPLVVIGYKKLGDKILYQRFRNNTHQYNPEIKLFDTLALAFSRGIIQPKIYA